MPTLEKTFELKQRGSTVRQEIIAGLTTFLAMVYSVIVVPICWVLQVFLRNLSLLPPV